MKQVDPTQVTIFKHPILAFTTLFHVILDKLHQLYQLSIKFWYVILTFSTFVYLTYHLKPLFIVRQIGYFCLYWLILGIASSIGLGTGLHTFVLYLGPHIAKVAIMATECGYVPQMVPSRWSFNHFKACQNTDKNEIAFVTILLAVQIEAFLWGFGTAIGQLPPYFIAKHAAEVQDKLKEIANQEQSKKLKGTNKQQKKLLELEVEQTQQELEQLQQIQKLQHKSKSQITLIDRIKLLIYNQLQKYGFLTVLLSASIPNPLFDLAGITCGHFKIPFRTFFSATFIGKAIIKVHIQMLFVITIFRKQTVSYIFSLVKQWFPKLETKMQDALEKQKKLLYSPESFQDNKPLIAQLWDYFLMLMILYFVISIINTSIQHRLVEQKLKKKLGIKGV